MLSAIVRCLSTRARLPKYPGRLYRLQYHSYNGRIDDVCVLNRALHSPDYTRTACRLQCE